MRAWPTKNAAKQVTSPTTKVTPAKTSDLAASTRPRFGTAIRLVRIIPEEYSELMQSTPSTAMAACAMSIPDWFTRRVPAQLVGDAELGVAVGGGRADDGPQADAEYDGHGQRPERRPDRTELGPLRAQHVAEGGCMQGPRWSGPAKAIVAPVTGSPRPPGTPRCPGSVP